MKKIFLLITILSLLFADIGPSPQKPNVIITFIEDEKPYHGNISLTYVCDMEKQEGESSLNDRVVNFSCKNGVCKNDMWFYKLNPCFYPTNGYFIVEREGKKQNISQFITFLKGNYDIVINLDKGEVTKVITENKEALELCASASFILLSCLGLIIIKK